MRAQMNAGKILDADADMGSEKPKHMMARLLQHKYNNVPNDCERMPDLDIISEAMGHMFVSFPPLPPSHHCFLLIFGLLMLLYTFTGSQAPTRPPSPSHIFSGN